EGEPDPPPGGDRGNAVAPQHREADGGEPSAASVEGARVARAPRREGRPYRPSRGRGAGPRCAADEARSPEGERGGVEPKRRRAAQGRPFAFRVMAGLRSPCRRPAALPEQPTSSAAPRRPSPRW